MCSRRSVWQAEGHVMMMVSPSRGNTSATIQALTCTPKRVRLNLCTLQQQQDPPAGGGQSRPCAWLAWHQPPSACVGALGQSLGQSQAWLAWQQPPGGSPPQPCCWPPTHQASALLHADTDRTDQPHTSAGEHKPQALATLSHNTSLVRTGLLKDGLG